MSKYTDFDGCKITKVEYGEYSQRNIGVPMAFTMYYYDEEILGESCYGVITVNLGYHNANCQFINRSFGESILDWLEENKFGHRTGNVVQHGFGRYHEFCFDGEEAATLKIKYYSEL